MRDVPIAPICETVVRERAASSATRNWRGLALGALLSLAISIGGNEWAYSTLVPLLVTYVAKAVPIAGLIALTAVYQLYELPGVPRQLRNRLLFCLGVYAGILVLGSMFWFTTSPHHRGHFRLDRRLRRRRGSMSVCASPSSADLPDAASAEPRKLRYGR